MAARGVGASVRLLRGSLTIVATPAGPVVDDWGFLSMPVPDGVSVTASAGSPVQAAKAVATGLEVSVDPWRRLDRYAHRTYASPTKIRVAAARERALAPTTDPRKEPARRDLRNHPAKRHSSRRRREVPTAVVPRESHPPRRAGLLLHRAADGRRAQSRCNRGFGRRTSQLICGRRRRPAHSQPMRPDTLTLLGASAIIATRTGRQRWSDVRFAGGGGSSPEGSQS